MRLTIAMVVISCFVCSAWGSNACTDPAKCKEAFKALNGKKHWSACYGRCADWDSRFYGLQITDSTWKPGNLADPWKREIEAHPYKSEDNVPGCYGYESGKYAGFFYFGTGGTDADKMKKPSAGKRFRPQCV
jgi:hypothetical protein